MTDTNKITDGEIFERFLLEKGLSGTDVFKKLGYTSPNAVYQKYKSTKFSNKFLKKAKEKLGFDLKEYDHESDRFIWGKDIVHTGNIHSMVPENPEQEIFKTKNNTFITIGDITVLQTYLIPMNAHANYYDQFCTDDASVQFFEHVQVPVEKIGKGNYLCFKVSGDSMDGELKTNTPDGTLVLARELGRHLWLSGFHTSKLGWIIVTKYNILFKDIIAHKGDIITCHSRNPSPQYQDFDLSLTEDVLQIFKVWKRYGM